MNNSLSYLFSLFLVFSSSSWLTHFRGKKFASHNWSLSLLLGRFVERHISVSCGIGWIILEVLLDEPRLLLGVELLCSWGLHGHIRVDCAIGFCFT